MQTTTHTTITQVGPNSFIVHAIDNRRRRGQSMCNLCADNGITSGTMTTLDGRTIQVEIAYNGWREMAMQTTTETTIIRQTRDQFVVPSRTRAGVVHVVRRLPGGLQCSCEAAVHGMRCWHVAAVATQLNAELAAKRTPTPAPDRALGLSLLTGGRL